MFEGKNELRLNQETMRKALQHWLNGEVLQDNHTVDDISFDTGVFVVTVSPTSENK